MTGTSTARGAYGLRLSQPLEDRFLLDVPADVPAWELQWRPGTYDEGTAERVGEDEAVVNLQPPGRAHIQRHAQRSTLYLENEPKTEAWPHPHLSSTAVVTARWLGRHAFHAGAFVHEGKAWAVLGARNDGKSSALAWLALQGLAVLADDIVLIDQDRVLAGPRCLDLRQSAHEHLQAGTYIGQIGTRERWRIPLGAAPYSAPFAGWIALAWDQDLATPTVRAAQRLPLLLGQRGLLIQETDEVGWLSLLARPMVQLRRPQDWATMGTAIEALLSKLSALTPDLGPY